MDFRALHNFTVVAEELHFGRAAKRLNIVQPALSRQIQKLEQYLQLQLFQRTNRQVKLTSAGAVFLEESRVLLVSLDAAIASARRAAEGKTGWISIGFIGATTLGLLPRIMQSFRKQSPEVELTLSDLSTFEQLSRLHQKRIHIGFVRGPVPPDCPDLKFETIAREPLALAIPKNHKLAKNTRVQVTSLEDVPFILYPRDLMSPWEILLRNICRKAGFVPNIVQRAIQVQTAIVLVSAGIGVTLVPSSVENFPQKGVVYRRLNETTVAELLVAYRADETSPAVHNFLDAMRKLIVL
jgi:DNA-binding transcriptional LysR family regulator